MIGRAVGCISAILIICFAGCGSVKPSVSTTTEDADTGMISIETAEAIALEKASSMAPELAAENIWLDENEPSKLMTLKDTTVWAVKFTYTVKDQPGTDVYNGILVMVDAFSGEVFRVYLSA